MTRYKEPAENLPEQTIDGEAPSKTSRKHQMHALQALGVRLVALDTGRLAKLDLPERLADAILLARGIKAHEGRRRQMQYIGKLMRDADADAIARTLDDWAAIPNAERAQFAAHENWRDRLFTEPLALEEFLTAHPRADRAKLSELVLEARAERARGGAPHHYRALFRYIKAATDESSAAGPPQRPNFPN